MEIFKDIYSSAHAQQRFLNDFEIGIAFDRFQKASAALEAAKQLAKSSEQLVSNASQIVFSKFPQHAFTQNDREKCSRDINYYLRIITYCLVTGGTGPIDDYVLPGLDEIYRTFNLDPNCSIEALRYLKANHGLKREGATEVESYIDYLINFFLLLPEPLLVERLHPLAISDVKKQFPSQWVTLEITKYQDNFPIEGRVISNSNSLDDLVDKFEQNSGNFYTFYTGNISENSK